MDKKDTYINKKKQEIPYKLNSRDNLKINNP